MTVKIDTYRPSIGTPVICNISGSYRIGNITGYSETDRETVYIDNLATFVSDIEYDIIKDNFPTDVFNDSQMLKINHLREKFLKRNKLTTLEKVIRKFEVDGMIPEVKQYGLDISYIIESLKFFLDDEMKMLDEFNRMGLGDVTLKPFFKEKFVNYFTRIKAV